MRWRAPTAALSDYAELMRSHDVAAVRMVATSATRDVSNRDEFFAMTSEVLGTVVPGAVAEVITGAEEAGTVVPRGGRRIGLRCSTFRRRRSRRRLHRGGARGSDDVVAGYSADIGCVRLTERCLHSDPPTADEIAAAREVVREALGEALRRGARRAGPHLGRSGGHDDDAGGAGAQDDRSTTPTRSICPGSASAICCRCVRICSR